MMTSESTCPYCGKDKVEKKGPKCFFCGMVLGDKYLIYIDGENNISNLCSTSCLDLLEESIKTDDQEDELEGDGNYMMGSTCPICGKETLTQSSDATTLCVTCGMLIDRPSPKYLIRGKSLNQYFCCSKCLNIYSASNGLEFHSLHTT